MGSLTRERFELGTVQIWLSQIEILVFSLVLRPWEESDLAKLNRLWVCITGVPLFLWHEDFFRMLLGLS